jgi:tRNA(Ile2) C34 agmatinyltransferase TiaS
MEAWLVGIDDTDNEESIGTGRLARHLAEHLVDTGLLTGPSITRHQLLVHPDIPYTSHNSSACIQGAADAAAAVKLLDAARSFLIANFHTGANPGLCVCRGDSVPAPLVELARRAQREVLRLDAFDALTRPLGLALWARGETGQGRIGACAGVALRSTGEDGRFIGLAGIRDLDGLLSVEEIVSRSGIEEVRAADGRRLEPGTRIDTQGWVRPSLLEGRPVLVVREENGCLVPTERRSADD